MKNQTAQKQIQNSSSEKRCEEASVVWGEWGVQSDEDKVRKETDGITPGCVDRVTCVVRSCDSVTMRVTIRKEWASI